MSFAYLKNVNKQSDITIHSFKNKYNLEDRKKESTTIREKYPDRIPVILEKQITSSLANIDKNKFLVPCDLTAGQFAYVIRRRIKLPPEHGIYIFISKEIIPPHFTLMSTLYKDYKDADGFLYITYTNENTFG